MRRLALLATLLLCVGTAVPAAARPEMYLDVSDVKACVTLPGARTLLATSGGVVVMGGSAARTLTRLDGLPDGSAYALLARGPGVWVGTGRGLAELSARSLSVRRTVLDVPVRALAADGAEILAGTFGRGVVRVDPVTLHTTATRTPDPRVLALAFFGGELYAGTMAGVVRRGRSGAFSLVPDATQPTFALETSPSRLVARTLVGALSIDARGVHPTIAPRAACPRPPPSRLPSNDLSALAADARGVWAGTFDRGLVRIEGGRAKRVSGVDTRINALAIDRRSASLWVGTDNGLYVVPEGAASGHPVETGVAYHVHALAPLAAGGVLAGTSRGALVVRGSDVSSVGRKQGLAELSVTAVDTFGRDLVLGTTRGLFVGRPGRLARLSVSSGVLPDDWITALASDRHAIYAGTYSHGVVRIARIQGKWQSRRLGGGYVNPGGVTLHAGTLWIATMNGLWSHPTSSGALVRHKRDALGRDVTAIAFAAGRAWIASRHGLLRLDSLSASSP